MAALKLRDRYLVLIHLAVRTLRNRAAVVGAAVAVADAHLVERRRIELVVETAWSVGLVCVGNVVVVRIVSGVDEREHVGLAALGQGLVVAIGQFHPELAVRLVDVVVDRGHADGDLALAESESGVPVAIGERVNFVANAFDLGMAAALDDPLAADDLVVHLHGLEKG